MNRCRINKTDFCPVNFVCTGSIATHNCSVQDQAEFIDNVSSHGVFQLMQWELQHFFRIHVTKSMGERSTTNCLIMKTTNPFFYTSALLLLFSTFCMGQQGAETPSLDNSSIEGQFQYVYQRSSDFEDFKMVKRWHFTKLKTHVLDSLKSEKEQLNIAGDKLERQKTVIDSLNTVITASNKQLTASIREKNQFTFMGISMQKAGYNSIVWTVIAGLSVSLLFLIMLYKRSYVTISQSKVDLQETRQEYEAFRKRALEREEGIVRKYHDELLKYKSKVNNL